KTEKEFLARILHREDYLEKILIKNKYFLIGEKGTGKTSYAVFLNNSDYSNTRSKVVSLSQTDYRRFIAMMQGGHYKISSYVDIWRVVLLLLSAESIRGLFKGKLDLFDKFRQLNQAIDEYYSSAFRPEVDQSLELIENSETAAKLVAKYAEVG